MNSKNFNTTADSRFIGTTQRTRLMNRINPLEISIDDRSKEELIAMLQEYATLLSFYEPGSDISRDWQDFFHADISAVLSFFICTDLTEDQYIINDSIKKYNTANDHSRKIDLLKTIISMIYQRIRAFEDLRDKLLRIQYRGGELEKFTYYDIEAYYEQAVAKHIKELVTIIHGLKVMAGNSKIGIEELNPVLVSYPSSYSEEDLPSEIEAAYIRLRILYNKVTETTLLIKENIKPFLQRSFEEKHDHQPHMGLLYGFLDQYKKLQSSINRIPEKFLHMYYVDFLKQSKKKHVPPYAYVSFEISPYVDNKILEEKTTLLATLDKEGIPHRFETIYPVNISQCRLSDIKTLYFDKGHRETLTNKYALITEAFMAPVANSQDGMGAPFNPDKLASWPTFGEDQIDKEPSLRNMTDAEIGFSVSSPVLHLNEGKRSISVKLNFAEKSTTDLTRLFRDISTKEHANTTMADIFFKIFSSKGKKRNITIFLTSAKGWYKVDPQTIKIYQDNEEDWHPGHICISFYLDTASPAIIPFNSQLHKGRRIEATQPTMIVLLNNEREPYLYSFLQRLIITEVLIETKVENVRQLSVYNEFGLIDNAQPFYPFGPSPGKNSYFLLGSREIFKKDIHEMEIEVDWFDLPKTPGLFNKKYEDYNIRYNDFRIKIANLSEGQFIVDDKDRPLFESLERTGSDNIRDEYLFTKYRITREELGSLGYKPGNILSGEDGYNAQTNSGYLKIILESPEDGFGQKRYQEVLSAHMVKNARLINKALVQDEDDPEPDIYFPAMPEIPMIGNITIRYTAQDRIDLTQDSETEQEINHIHPFGSEKIYPNIKFQDQLPYLLPQYEEDGYLFLGLENCKKTETVSLLFQMTPVYRQDKDQYILPVIKWQYLTYNNVWKELPGSNIIRDETDIFTNTGVIQIKIPADISHLSAVMQEGKFWLRVCATGDIQLFNHTISIYPNATLTRWIDRSDPSGLNEPFPPYSIVAIESKIQGITKVNQPFESFGGKAEETFIQFYTRVSERLRHKNRGWTAWDVERLILSRFDDIEQVRCFSGIAGSGERAYEYLDLDDKNQAFEINYRASIEEFNSNKVILVIVPRKLKYLKEHIPIANFRKLEQIRRFIKDKMSPFVSIKVRNPEFEYLRIQCDIKFTERGNEGYDMARLKDIIAGFICPWYIDQSDAIEFNKEINVDALKEYIRSFDFVKFITKFSVIQIIEDRDQYHMLDSADSGELMPILKPTRPWAAFIPDQEHNISIIEDEIEAEPQKIQAPVRFKNEYNILKKTRIIQIKKAGVTDNTEKTTARPAFDPFIIEL